MINTISWFEIPATNLDRACQFYSKVFDTEITPADFGQAKMGLFPGQQSGGVTGALMLHEAYIPSESHGPLIYLNGGDDLQPMLDRIDAAGGKVLMPKTQISEEVGYMALFLDSEGNRMALHSRN